MHVLQLGPYPPPEGGITRNILAIREELQRKGHKCSIVAIAKSTAVKHEPEVYHPQNAFQLIRLLVALDYDVLHVHAGGDIPLRFFAFLWVCRLIGKGQKILTFHSGGYALRNIKTARRLSFAGTLFRAYKRIICVNPIMVEMFEKFGVNKEQLNLIYPFRLERPDESIDLPETYLRFADKHNPFILTIGLLEGEYDLSLQIDTMKEILSTYPSAGLMVVGSGSLENDLRRLIASKSYAENILLTGDVEHKITVKLIDRCQVVLRTTQYDGDAIAIREALFLGTTVIATDNEMRPDGVDLIPCPAKGDDLVSKIIEVLGRGKKPHYVEISDGRENIEAVIKVYEELLLS